MKGSMMKGSKEGPSIAFLLGGGKDKSAEEEEEKDEGYTSAGLEECRSHLETAFPDEDWSDDKRVMAVKELVTAIAPTK